MIFIFKSYSKLSLLCAVALLGAVVLAVPDGVYAMGKSSEETPKTADKEFKEGNIKTSFNLDFQKREFIDNLESLNKEKEYLIYCASGNRSLKASHIMKSLGFKTIYNYKKGYKDWIKD